jgi:hypothetical protein
VLAKVTTYIYKQTTHFRILGTGGVDDMLRLPGTTSLSDVA